MDIAGQFATLVSLLIEFAKERRHGTARTYEEFRAWLADHRHEDIMRLLEQNATTIVSIKAILNQEHGALRQQLERIDRNLALLVSNAPGFGELAVALYPDATLSQDAIQFLRTFAESRAGRMLEIVAANGRFLLPLEGQLPSIDSSNWRFFEDDVQTLAECRLLRLLQQADGKRVFVLTRRAMDFLHALDERARRHP